MSDTFGALAFPPHVPAGESPGDTTLDKIGAYLLAVLNADDGPLPDWQSIDRNAPVCRKYFTHLPIEGEFNERDLPAIFLAREVVADEQIADEYPTERTQLTILWVPEPRPQVRRTAQGTFAAAVRRTIDRAFYLGRHAAWFDHGDIEANREFGSLVVERANLLQDVYPVSGALVPVTIELDGSEPRTYVGSKTVVQIVELLELDLDAHTRWSVPSAMNTKLWLDQTQEPVVIPDAILIGETED